MKRGHLLAIGSILIVIFVILRFSANSSETNSAILVSVEQGTFIVDVTTSGTLEAKNSVPIKGPQGIRNYRIWNVTVQDIIEEGTLVKKGQYVARLDPSEIAGKIKDAQLEVQQSQSQFTQTKLDTALTMRQARDELINLDYTVTEKKLILEQSQFEPPATIQKAQIEWQKAKRALNQAQENYDIKRRQNIAKMQEASAELQGDKNDLDGLLELQSSFVILAPQDGMLIYKRNRVGQPVKAGSQVSAWDPIVATLPDLSKMITKTYVNEVDVRKVKVGQPVDIGFDAFPDKRLQGRVTKVANVGEQRPNSDAKVFVVEIEVFGTDPVLKPGMTTSSRIITMSIDSAIYVPLESLHSQHDSITFVYKKDGSRTTKQEVRLGAANAEYVNIKSGLRAEDRIFLSDLKGMENKDILLLPEMDGLRNPGVESESEKPVQTLQAGN